MYFIQKACIIVLLITRFSGSVFAQAQESLIDNSWRGKAISQIVKNYTDFLSEQSSLYNGPQYTGYNKPFQTGQPFFLNEEYHTASVFYDHLWYHNVPIRYDLVRNVIAIKGPAGPQLLFTEKIGSMSVEGHQFVQVPAMGGQNDIPETGLYELLFNHKQLVLLHKETKRILDNIDASAEIKQYVETEDLYYLKNRNGYYPVNKESQFLTLLKDKKTEIRQFIRKSKLNFKKNKPGALVGVLKYYTSQIPTGSTDNPISE
jgi:hypothetical protein